MTRCVSDTAVFGTCRDYPDEFINYPLLKGDLLFSERPGPHGLVPLATNDQNGRVGNAMAKARLRFLDAFVPQPHARTRRRKSKIR